MNAKSVSHYAIVGVGRPSPMAHNLYRPLQLSSQKRQRTSLDGPYILLDLLLPSTVSSVLWTMIWEVGPNNRKPRNPYCNLRRCGTGVSPRRPYTRPSCRPLASQARDTRVVLVKLERGARRPLSSEAVRTSTPRRGLCTRCGTRRRLLRRPTRLPAFCYLRGYGYLRGYFYRRSVPLGKTMVCSSGSPWRHCDASWIRNDPRHFSTRRGYFAL